MTLVYNGTKFKSGKWQNIKSCRVLNKNNQLYDYLQDQKKCGNISIDDNWVEYFIINGVKITLNDLYCRGGIMGFDFNYTRYPKNINCYTDKINYAGTLCELNEYGEKLRVWEEI